MSDWTINDIPDQTGRLAVVSGATGGLGYETALALAGAGATTILTGRNPAKGADALARISAIHPKADITFEELDLSSLAKVAAFAESFGARHDRLDILVNNAGVMAPPNRQETADGFELQLGTNHLGHFALTAHLLPLLGSGKARVVSLGSIAAHRGAIHFDDLQTLNRRYDPMEVYSQSKLACVLFALELQRRSDANGYGIASIAAHPGVSRTDLIDNGMGRDSLAGRLRPLLGLVFQSAAHGALPQLFAATDPAAEPGGYYGPNGFMELRGAPTKASIPPQARDARTAARLWDVSEQLTGALFPRQRAAA
jgi:NAD(P)-dependent dehydrogenase (short-subunit alcohol dehydrogenase family)